MDELERGGATGGVLGEGIACLLAIHASGADRSRSGRWDTWERNVRDHFVLNQRFETRKRNVPKTTVPELVIRNLCRGGGLRL